MGAERQAIRARVKRIMDERTEHVRGIPSSHEFFHRLTTAEVTASVRGEREQVSIGGYLFWGRTRALAQAKGLAWFRSRDPR